MKKKRSSRNVCNWSNLLFLTMLRRSWSLRLKLLLEKKKNFDLQARRWLISEVPGSIDEAFVCFACGTTLYELNKVWCESMDYKSLQNARKQKFLSFFFDRIMPKYFWQFVRSIHFIELSSDKTYFFILFFFFLFHF